MPWPEEVPVFRPEDILISPDEYEIGNKRTTVGWLKHLFLYDQIDSQHIWITDESRKNYKTALDRLQKIGIIKESPNYWEDGVTAKKQASLLNKLMRSLGYVVVEEV
jgi:hypothetical protein